MAHLRAPWLESESVNAGYWRVATNGERAIAEVPNPNAREIESGNQSPLDVLESPSHCQAIPWLNWHPLPQFFPSEKNLPKHLLITPDFEYSINALD